MVWKLGDITLIKILFGNNEVMQFHFWEYIDQNQTYILDSHVLPLCGEYICIKNIGQK